MQAPSYDDRVTITRLSRRELNKVRTREAIVAAVRALAETAPITDVTAEQVAERAGISRRTFFNYFTGVDAVISHVLGELVSGLAGPLLARPTDEQPFASVQAVLTDDALRPLLTWVATLGAHRVGADEGTVDRIAAGIWQNQGARLRGVIAQRVGRPLDDLYVTTLAVTLMTLFDCVSQEWTEDLRGRTSLRAKDITDFRTRLHTALDYASSGWAPTR